MEGSSRLEQKLIKQKIGKKIEKNEQNPKLVLWKDQQNDKPLARLTKKQREMIPITKIRNKRGHYYQLHKNKKDYYIN